MTMASFFFKKKFLLDCHVRQKNILDWIRGVIYPV